MARESLFGEALFYYISLREKRKPQKESPKRLSQEVDFY
jgi:hypothetical protein